MAPAGRIILTAAARGGLWARAESTPFGHGRPFTRGQLERLVREAGLEPTAWSRALYMPPWTPLLPLADGFEQIGRHVFPGAAGVIMLEATPQGLCPHKTRWRGAPDRPAASSAWSVPRPSRPTNCRVPERPDLAPDGSTKRS